MLFVLRSKWSQREVSHCQKVMPNVNMNILLVIVPLTSMLSIFRKEKRNSEKHVGSLLGCEGLVQALAVCTGPTEGGVFTAPSRCCPDLLGGAAAGVGCRWLTATHFSRLAWAARSYLVWRCLAGYSCKGVTYAQRMKDQENNSSGSFWVGSFCGAIHTPKPRMGSG